jgi:hypothetical protein
MSADTLRLCGGVNDAAHGGNAPQRGVSPATPELASRGGRIGVSTEVHEHLSLDRETLAGTRVL